MQSMHSPLSWFGGLPSKLIIFPFDRLIRF
jgi:hypothetical protein